MASFVSVKPRLSYHLVSTHDGCHVDHIQDMNQTSIRINGGYFLFKRSIFEYIRDGDELVGEPFQRLIKEQELICYSYDGFWAGMDTFKDKQMLDEMYARGAAPWEVWNPRLGLTCPR